MYIYIYIYKYGDIPLYTMKHTSPSFSTNLANHGAPPCSRLTKFVDK